LKLGEIGFDQSGNSLANNAGLTRLGLNWVCFWAAPAGQIFCKSFLDKHLNSFGYPENWVCFA